MNIYFFVITSRKVSAVLFLKKKAPLRIFPYVFETFVAAISKHSHEKIYEKLRRNVQERATENRKSNQTRSKTSERKITW